MAKYTTSICDILTNANTEGGSLKDLDNLYNLGSQYVFGESATNVLDDEYKRNFVIGFCLHYMFDEIGLETLPAFQIQLLERIFNNKAYIETMFDAIDREVYGSYMVHIKDTTDTRDVSVSEDVETTGTSGETRNFTDTNTRDLTDERTYNVTDALSGSDTTSNTGTQATANTGTDTTQSAHSGSDTVANTGTDNTTFGQTHNLTRDTGVGQQIKTTVTPDDYATTTTFDDYQTEFVDDLKYTDSASGGQNTENWAVDGSRTRSIGQMAQLPQNGVNGSDVIGSSSSDILGGGSSATGSKYLSDAQISDYQSAGDVTNQNTDITVGSIKFKNHTFTHPVMNTSLTGTENEVTHTVDGSHNTQTTTQNGSKTDTVSGSMETVVEGMLTGSGAMAEVGGLGTHTKEVVNDTISNGSNNRTLNTQTQQTYNSNVTNTTTLNDTSTTTNNLETETEYGRQNHKSGTDTLDQSGTDTITHTGSGSTTSSGTVDRGETTDEDKTGHLNESFVEMSYETLIASTSLMNKIWEIFDNLFLQLL